MQIASPGPKPELLSDIRLLRGTFTGTAEFCTIYRAT